MNAYNQELNAAQHENGLMMNRRQLLGRGALGLGTAALAGLMSSRLEAAGAAGLGGTHHAPKAKRVIYLFMSGGPSQHDLFDYKPKMREPGVAGKPMPKEVLGGQRVTGMSGGSARQGFPAMPSKYKFKKYDNNDQGVWVSELLPHTATVAKDLCVVHSAFTEAINHDPAVTYIQTGSQLPGRPSLGAWLSYGLGSMNRDLPNYVVMHAHSKHAEQSLFNRLWGTGFMPANHQGVLLRGGRDAVLYLNNPKGVGRTDRRSQLNALLKLNRGLHDFQQDPDMLARIEQHEMAYRMQASVPELMDLSQEPEEVFELYGKDARKPGTFAACCLNARRLAERGVRNIQIFHRGWDAHNKLPTEHGSQCLDVDQACAGLIKDLKRRGMLEDTLVVWGGEFGRTAYSQGGSMTNYGRDHHPRCFTIWMAGGGVKPGITYGKTDEYGYNILDPNGQRMTGDLPSKHHWTPGTMHIHDLNATILHLLGIDHTKLTYRYQGRDFRLTDIHGHVIKDILA